MFEFEKRHIDNSLIKEIMYKLTLVLLGLVLFSCNDVDPNQSPNPFFSTDGRYGDFKTDTLYAISDSIIYKEDPNTYLATKVTVGNYGDFKTAFVIAFVNSLLPPDSIISVVDSVKLGFTSINNMGQEADINIDIYKINKYWSTEINKDVTWKDPLDSIEFITSGIIKYALKGDSSYSEVALPVNVFDDWRNSTSENPTNYGLYIKASDGQEGNLIELSSAFNNSGLPRMTYYYRDEVMVDSVAVDSIFSIPILASATAPIFSYDKSNGTALRADEGTVLISSGVITQTLLKFDFNSLPEDAIYYSADLKLHLDFNNIYENPLNNSLFEVRGVEKFEEEPLLNPNTAFLLTADDAVTNFNIFAKDFATIFLQALKNGIIENKWLLVKFPIEYREISVVKFYGAATVQKDLTPYIIVKYLSNDN